MARTYRDHPVCQVTMHRDLHAAQHGQVNMAATRNRRHITGYSMATPMPVAATIPWYHSRVFGLVIHTYYVHDYSKHDLLLKYLRKEGEKFVGIFCGFKF